MARQATRLWAQGPPPGALISLAGAVGAAAAVTPDLSADSRGRSFEALCDPPYRPTGGNAARNLFALLKPQRYQSPPAWRWSNPSIASQDPIDAALVPPLKRSRDVRHTLTALPALPQLSLLFRREPCPCMPLHSHTSSSAKIRRCCVDSLNSPPKADNGRRVSKSALCQKQTLGNDGLLRCRSRFFNQRCHLARVRKKDCVAARKFNDLRLGPLRHEPLKVWVGHPILFGDHGVARLLFPGCNRGLRAKCVTCNRYLRDRHEARDRLKRIGREIGRKRIGIHGEEAVAYRSDAFGGRRHFVAQIGNALPDIRLEGRHENESLDAGMRPHFVDDHPAIAVADQHTRTYLVENAARRSHVCRETRLRLLDNSYRVTVALENVRHRLPSGAIGEGAVDQNDSLDDRVRRG